jgi:hypothetical protein
MDRGREREREKTKRKKKRIYVRSRWLRFIITDAIIDVIFFLPPPASLLDRKVRYLPPLSGSSSGDPGVGASMHQKYNYKVGGLGHEPITPFDRYGRLLLCGGNPASVHTPLLLPYAFHGPLVMPVFVLIDGSGKIRRRRCFPHRNQHVHRKPTEIQVEICVV